MADDYCKLLLESWNLETLVSQFKDNGIDEDTFKNLTADTIKELIPHIGRRIKFTQKWQELFGKTSSIVACAMTPEQSDDTDTTVSVSSDASSSDEFANTDRNTQGSHGAKTVLTKLNHRHVKRVLHASMEGRAVLKSYKSSKSLSRKCRHIIVNLIISEIFTDIERVKSFRVQDLESVAMEIVEVFPTEASDTYYIAPVKKNESRWSKSISSRGKLVDKFRNKKREYKGLAGDLSSEDSSTDVDHNMESDVQNIAENSEIQNSVTWLQQNQAPWELVKSHWAATSEYRRNAISQLKFRNVSDIFDKWPILRHPNGHELIIEDFELHKLTTNNDAITNWQNFVEKIEKISTVPKDRGPKDLYEILKTEDLNINTKVAVQLSLLSYLIPPKARIRAKAKHWKPSTHECHESMIVHAKIHGDVSRIQQQKSDAMNAFKLTVQPYIIVVGRTLEEISAFYVCIDKTLYDVSSVLTAVDVCFKAFHVLDATYPPESEHIWLIIQRCLYKFHTKFDKPISYIMEIIKHLEG